MSVLLIIIILLFELYSTLVVISLAATVQPDNLLQVTDQVCATYHTRRKLIYTLYWRISFTFLFVSSTYSQCSHPLYERHKNLTRLIGWDITSAENSIQLVPRDYIVQGQIMEMHVQWKKKKRVCAFYVRAWAHEKKSSQDKVRMRSEIILRLKLTAQWSICIWKGFLFFSHEIKEIPGSSAYQAARDPAWGREKEFLDLRLQIKTRV